jgi:hypothetical protein
MIAVGVLVLAGGMSANGATIFNFSSPPGDGSLGVSSEAITVGAYTLTAYGYQVGSPNTAYTLYKKNDGSDEIGLGFANTTGAGDNEITLNSGGTAIANFIQVDVNAIKTAFTGGFISAGSVTNGEKWDIYGSNTLGSIGTDLVSGNTADQTFIPLPGWGSYQYYSIAVTPNANSPLDNVLLSEIEVTTPVPEPATMSLLGLGLGAIFIRRRKAAK